MIAVNVFLHTILQRMTPEGPQRRVVATLEEGATVLGLIRHLEIDYAAEDLMIAVNGRVADPGQSLADGDKVHLMLPISGGMAGWGTPA